MKKKTPLYIAAFFALIAGFLIGQYSLDRPTQKPPVIQGVILPEAKALKKFTLLDDESQKLSLQALKGHWSLIFMGYTHCPDVCPTTLRVLQQLTQQMKAQSLTPPAVIFVSIDPQRDSIEQLHDYVKYFESDFTGATGTEKELKNLASQLHVFYEKSAGSSGDIKQDDYLMNHSSSLMLINPQAELQAFITAPHTVAGIIHAIETSRAYYRKSHP